MNQLFKDFVFFEKWNLNLLFSSKDLHVNLNY